MIAILHSASIHGIEANTIRVETDLSAGIPGLTIVGLPDTAVNESKERIKAAIKNSGYSFPLKKVVINLAPADVRKEGSGFDLPMSLGILIASEALQPTPFLESACFIGELSLEGSLRRVNGILSMAITAREKGFQSIVVPFDNVAEASLVEGIDVYGLNHLGELPLFLVHPHSFIADTAKLRASWLSQLSQKQEKSTLIDFSDIKGQHQAKRVLEIAAAGGHNTLMIGPPGSGKSMLSKAFAGILPPLSEQEMLDVSRIYSAAGHLSKQQPLITDRPFRSPHHSASAAGLVGGGNPPKPGEITLAHRGVLFLDEFVEFNRHAMEVLRQPLEDGVITISRAHQSHTFPARFTLVAALNPCPCGYRGDSVKACQCSDTLVQRYLSKLSGPLLDRIDLHLEVPRLSAEALLRRDVSETPTESSLTIRSRVIQAREIQRNRFELLPTPQGSHRPVTNADLSARELRLLCPLSENAQEYLFKAMKRLNWSARAFDRILRVARTIADLAACQAIEIPHLAEALQYRYLDRQTNHHHSTVA